MLRFSKRLICLVTFLLAALFSGVVISEYRPPQAVLEMHDAIMSNPSLLNRETASPRAAVPGQTQRNRPRMTREEPPPPLEVLVFVREINPALEESAMYAQALEERYPGRVTFAYFLILDKDSRPKQWGEQDEFKHFMKYGAQPDTDAVIAMRHGVRDVPVALLRYQGRQSIIPLHDMPKTTMQALDRLTNR